MSLVSKIPIAAIEIGERLRPLSEPAVADLTESLPRIGQIQPITVVQRGEKVRLVTGHHRLVAARRIGMKTIVATVLSASTTDDECLQLEIAENLHRSNLTKEQRDEHIRLLAELLGRKRAGEVSQQNASKPKPGPMGGRPQGIVSEVAEQTGLSKDTVRRALNPEEEAAKKAEKETARKQREEQQAEHDRQRAEAVASLPESIQRAEAAKEANRQKTRSATGEGEGAEYDEQVAAVLSAWDAASPIARRAFILARSLVEDAESRVAELEEAVRTLEARNAELETENKFYGEMKASWRQGGFEKVIADRDEQIRVLREQFHNENAEKIKNLNYAKWATKELRKLGYSSDILIDAKTGEVRHG